MGVAVAAVFAVPSSGRAAELLAQACHQRMVWGCCHFVHSESSPSSGEWFSASVELASAVVLVEQGEDWRPPFPRSSQLGDLLLPVLCCPYTRSQFCC